MFLDAVIGCSGADLRRNGTFQNLGFISDVRDELLVFLSEARFRSALLENPYVSAVITTPFLSALVPRALALATCDDPRAAFARIHNYLCQSDFYWHDFPTVIHPAANVHPSAWVAETNVRIGPRTVVGPRATVLERCEIGEDCVIGAGSVLGGVGLQTVNTGNTLLEMQHAGGLLLHNRVHILPGAVVATGIFRQHTQLGDDVRVGAQAFVSHAVQVGAASFVGHGAVVNGNVSIGERVWIGPGAVVTHGVKIFDHAVVSLGAVVIRDVDAHARVSGNFAEPHRMLLRRMAAAGSKD